MGGQKTDREEVKEENDVVAVGWEENRGGIKQPGFRKGNCFCKAVGKPLCKGKRKKIQGVLQPVPLLACSVPQGRNKLRIRKCHCSLLVGGLF